jgi:serine/threonine protein kinase/beta-lactam-binding protein with PASTA domain
MIAGRYQLGNLIGRGGMADVYEGVDTRLGRIVAIKLLKSDLANDASFEARFRQEAQSSARMAHPTIVRIYDAGEEEGVDYNGNKIRRPYIVMEFVKGAVLRDLLHKRRLTIEEALEYTDGVLTALSTSHRSGIIHRDIKSANIMITEAGAVKVMDFGIARAMSDSSSTQAHSVGIQGTAQYFSPEQARGENVDGRTDLYSTGVLLYEMLAGRPPFRGETAVSVAYQHVSEAVTPPSEHNPQIPRELDAVVLQALAKDRNDRFQTADDFKEHLRAAYAAATGSSQYQTAGLPAADTATSVLPAAATTPVDLDFEALLRGEQPTFAEEPSIAAEPDSAEATQVITPSPVEATPTAPVDSTPPIFEQFTGVQDVARGDVEYVNDDPGAGVKTPELKPAASVSADTSLITNPFAALGLEEPTTSQNTAVGTLTSSQSIVRPRRSASAPSPKVLWSVGSGLTVVVVGLLIWFLSLGALPTINVNPTSGGIAVANVVNQTYTDGYNTLINQKLAVNKVYQASDVVPVDMIISTDPVAGTKVGEHQLITVYVSSGKGQVVVPDLTGLTEEAATTALTNAKLSLGNIVTTNSATIPLGQVISTDQVVGAKVAAGTVVNLTVSNGQVLVPDVRNLDQVAALAKLSAPDVQLVPVVQSATPCTGTLGTVILDQSIMPGLTAQGSTIILTVACNP